MKEDHYQKNEQFFNDDIVGFTITGMPIDIATYKKDITRAENNIKNGEIISQEDLERESEDW